MAVTAANRVLCNSSATLTEHSLAISETTGALAMRRATLAMHRATLAMHRAALAMNGAVLAVHRAALAMHRAALPVDRGALAMNGAVLAVHGAALAVHRAALPVDLLSMLRGPARPVGGADNLAKVESVVVRNLTPAFASFELPCDRVEALARCVSEQVCIFQASVAEARRRLLGLEGIDGNSGFVGNSGQGVRASSGSSRVRGSAPHEKERGSDQV